MDLVISKDFSNIHDSVVQEHEILAGSKQSRVPAREKMSYQKEKQATLVLKPLLDAFT